MPSANQEWRVSRDKSASGRTASERIPAIRPPLRSRPSQSPGFASNRMAATAATSGTDHHTLGRPRVGGLGRVGGAVGRGAAGARSGAAGSRARTAAISARVSASGCISYSRASCDTNSSYTCAALGRSPSRSSSEILRRTSSSSRGVRRAARRAQLTAAVRSPLASLRSMRARAPRLAASLSRARSVSSQRSKSGASEMKNAREGDNSRQGRHARKDAHARNGIAARGNCDGGRVIPTPAVPRSSSR